MSVLVACPNPNDKEFLVEDKDYIDLSSKYDGESFDCSESLWYMNQLKDVPLPDPFVFVENDTYYVVGTSDRSINTVDCYAETGIEPVWKLLRRILSPVRLPIPPLGHK